MMGADQESGSYGLAVVFCQKQLLTLQLGIPQCWTRLPWRRGELMT